jgi:hypothetical protein
LFYCQSNEIDNTICIGQTHTYSWKCYSEIWERPRTEQRPSHVEEGILLAELYLEIFRAIVTVIGVLRCYS